MQIIIKMEIKQLKVPISKTGHYTAQLGKYQASNKLIYNISSCSINFSEPNKLDLVVLVKDEKGKTVKRVYNAEDVVRVKIVPIDDQLSLFSRKRKMWVYAKLPLCEPKFEQGLVEVLGKAIVSKA